MERANQIAPAMLQIPDAAKYSGLSRTRVYELISTGALDARKMGKRTIISRASIDAFLADLPKSARKTAPQAA